MQFNLNKVALALAAAGLVSGLAGCGGGGGGGNPKPEGKIFQIQFVDAADNRQINDELTVNFSGVSRADVRTVADIAPQDGQYDAIKDTVKVSTGAIPVAALSFNNTGTDRFTVSASGSDWVASSVEVSPTSPGLITVKLLKNIGTAGYKVATDPGNISERTLTATATTTSGQSASIELPKGITAVGASSNELNVTVVSFPHDKSYDNLNGTFALDTTSEVVRYIVTDSNGKVIKKFTGDKVKLSINLPAGSNFPGTSTLLQGTETNYPIWYYDEAKQEWVPHSETGTVTKNLDGTFTVTFYSDHLSDWRLNPSYSSATTCITSSMSLTGRPAGDMTPLYIRFVGSGAGSTFDKTIGPEYESTLKLQYPPRETVNIYISASTTPNDSNKLGSKTGVNLCTDTKPITVALSGMVAPTTTSLTVQTRQFCTNSTSVINPLSTPVSYQYKLASGFYTTLSGVTDVNGNLTWNNIPLNTIGQLAIWNPYRSPAAGYVYPTNYPTNAPTDYQVYQNPQTDQFSYGVYCPTGTFN